MSSIKRLGEGLSDAAKMRSDQSQMRLRFSEENFLLPEGVFEPAESSKLSHPELKYYIKYLCESINNTE